MPQSSAARQMLMKKTAGVVAASGLAGESTLKNKLKGMMADNKRGHLLYQQGYGEYYDSALEIAKKGKSAGKSKRTAGVRVKF